MQWQGWIRAVRKSKYRTFIDVSNGHASHQVVTDDKGPFHVGSAVQCHGTWTTHNKQTEFVADAIRIVGPSHSLHYPLQNKDHNATFLRGFPQFTTRRPYVANIMKTKSRMILEIHKYLQEQLDFLHVHTPILTNNDCEEGGDAFEIKSSLFKKQAYLTVSSQLHLECMAFQRAYTISPCFRAERTLSSRHLAEFHMLECEVQFLDRLDDLINLAIDLLNHILVALSLKPLTFTTLTYDEAYKLLQSLHDYENPLEYGDFTSDQEQSLLVHLNTAAIVTHFPKAHKPFYMKAHDGYAECFDLLVPGAGEVVGGSLRSLDHMPIDWYNDIRQHGATPHGGFGMGIERLLMYTLGLDSIRDTMPFPRYYKHMRC